jgi:hypothetical protein
MREHPAQLDMRTGALPPEVPNQAVTTVAMRQRSDSCAAGCAWMGTL